MSKAATTYYRKVTQIVKVTVDPTKFTKEFMQEFRDSFYQFHTIEDHVNHLAQLFARGLYPEIGDPFIEGYGHAKEFGIVAEVLLRETDVEPHNI